MPGTRRRLVVRPRYASINEEAVHLFARAMEAGRGSPEHIRIASALHRALNRKPWDTDILSVDADAPPPRDSDSMRLASWRTAVELRRQLEQAIAETASRGRGAEEADARA
jgi:hypothetical protein